MEKLPLATHPKKKLRAIQQEQGSIYLSSVDRIKKHESPLDIEMSKVKMNESQSFVLKSDRINGSDTMYHFHAYINPSKKNRIQKTDHFSTARISLPPDQN
jgi:hypothetical protein